MRFDDATTQAWMILSACAVLTVIAGVLLLPHAFDWARDEIMRGYHEGQAAAEAEAIADRAMQPANSVRLTDPAQWITADDYPVDALRRNQQGRVAMRANFGEDGRPVNCIITESSGHASLDTATCAAIMRNARMSPAGGGEQSRSITRRVVWQLPDAPTVPGTEGR